MFKDGQKMFTMKSDVVGRRYVVNDGLFKVLTKNFAKEGASQFQNFLCEFPQILCTVLYIIVVRLGYHQFCTRWLQNMLTGARKTQRMASALTFLERYYKDGDEFPNHIVTVDET
jgi:hypothetical protein